MAELPSFPKKDKTALLYSKFVVKGIQEDKIKSIKASMLKGSISRVSSQTIIKSALRNSAGSHNLERNEQQKAIKIF